ncbi:hypothetical protein [Streptomyces sp. NPDC002644]
MSSGYDGISLAGRWECGACAASGDGWWDEDEGLTLHDPNGHPISAHTCDD